MTRTSWLKDAEKWVLIRCSCLWGPLGVILFYCTKRNKAKWFFGLLIGFGGYLGVGYLSGPLVFRSVWRCREVPSRKHDWLLPALWKASPAPQQQSSDLGPGLNKWGSQLVSVRAILTPLQAFSLYPDFVQEKSQCSGIVWRFTELWWIKNLLGFKTLSKFPLNT